MIPRITFLLIAVFWVAMNVLLWRAEYDSNGTGIRVPAALVWQKILTAPDISSLNVFQDGDRTGFCEFSTSVEQEMATLGENDPMLKNLDSHGGYQFRFNGNVSLGDYTNRLTFNGQLEFSRRRVLREFNLKLSTHVVTVEIHSIASEQTVHLTITTDGATSEQVFTFADLQNPGILWGSLAGNFGEWAQELDLPVVSQVSAVLPESVQWEAHYDRLNVRGESVPTYRLETRIFDHPLVVYVSTLGEILYVKLPGGVIASYDQLGNP
jgi:hypothetical protein